MLNDRRTCCDWSETGGQLVSDHTSEEKTVAMVAEVAIIISRQEVTPQSQALSDRGTEGGFNYLHAGYFNAFCRLLFIFQNHLFRKLFQEYLHSVKTVQIQIRPDISSGLFWIQTVCNGYQQTTLVNKELKYSWFSER